LLKIVACLLRQNLVVVAEKGACMEMEEQKLVAIIDLIERDGGLFKERELLFCS
jgi:hypothetical protein